MQTIQIRIISDIICPWCYVAKVKLKKAIAQLDGQLHFELEHLPFQLYPAIPVGGVPKEQFSSQRKKGMGQALRMESEKEGITIDYRKISRVPNTLEAHRLLYLIGPGAKQDQVLMRLFELYFGEGAPVEGMAELVKVAEAFQVDPTLLDTFSNSVSGTTEVQEAIHSYRESGIAGVPAIQIDDRHPIIGVQETSTLVRFFRKLVQ